MNFRKRTKKNFDVVKKLPVYITEEEYIELIKHTKKPHHKLAFLLGFESGLRVSEVVKLKPENILIQQGIIKIENAKGGKDRIVPLPKRFREKHLKLLPIKAGVRALEIAFKSACRRAGLLKIKPDLHFHSLRHGFATHSLNKGIPLHVIRTFMGHSNISTTNVYLRVNPKEALKKYEELF